MKNKFVKLNLKSCFLVLFVCVTVVAFTSPKYSLVGKWTIYDGNGTSVGEYVDLKADNSYTVTLPDGSIGERGTYLFKDPVFSIKNIKDVCGKDYWGKYNLTFVGADSIHFTLIEDSCSERRMDIVGYNPG
ncbi:MAG TPA: hypothetical protein VK772_16260, partial [Puia sp.]|nr:hypothetical protein [Puia sp.]